MDLSMYGVVKIRDGQDLEKKDLLLNFPTFEQLISLLFHLQRLFNFGHDCSDWIRSGDDSGTKRLQATSLKASRGKSDAVNRLKG